MINEINSDSKTAPQDSYIPPIDNFGTTYTEHQFNVENTNQRGNVPANGCASCEDNPIVSMEDFSRIPTTNVAVISEDWNEMFLLQEVAPNSRPPAEDLISWPTPGSFVNYFQETGLFSKTFPTLFPYASLYPTCCDKTFSIYMKKIRRIS